MPLCALSLVLQAVRERRIAEAPRRCGPWPVALTGGQGPPPGTPLARPPKCRVHPVSSIFGAWLQKGVTKTMFCRLTFQEFCLRSQVVSSIYNQFSFFFF